MAERLGFNPDNKPSTRESLRAVNKQIKDIDLAMTGDPAEGANGILEAGKFDKEGNEDAAAERAKLAEQRDALMESLPEMTIEEINAEITKIDEALTGSTDRALKEVLEEERAALTEERDSRGEDEMAA